MVRRKTDPSRQMPDTPSTPDNLTSYRHWPYITGFGVLLVLIGFIYIQGSHARWMFDDGFTLQGLAQVTDRNSALDYLSSGTTGVLGRPLSLASFLLQKSHWPDNPSGFRHFNLLIHGINGLLLALACWLIGRQLLPTTKRALQVSFLSAGLWLAHPLLASSVLSVVQRMTLLSATCVLLGLVLYVHGRSLLGTRPSRGLLWMSSGVALGGTLGVLAKENAILLPLLITVLEATLLRNWKNTIDPKYIRAWKMVFLALPLILLAGYIFWSWPSREATYLYRPFTLAERLSSEAVILWQYIGQIFIPNVTSLGLFHDDAVIYSPSDGLVVVSGAAWISVLILALYLRHKAPLFSFAVLWFLANHVLESTILPLELYFEHRNYLAIAGPLIGLAALGTSGRLSPRLNAVPLMLLPLLLFLLWRVTTLWGNPAIAAESWHRAHPNSSRATIFHVQQLLLDNRAEKARSTMLQAAERNPAVPELALQAIQLSCETASAKDISTLLQRIRSQIDSYHGSFAAAETLGRITTLVHEGKCQGISEPQLTDLIQLFLSSEKFSQAGLIRHSLYHSLGVIHLNKEDYASAVAFFDKGFEASPSINTALLISGILLSQGQPEIALRALDDAMKKAPKSYLGKQKWIRKSSAVRQLIEQQLGHQ